MMMTTPAMQARHVLGRAQAGGYVDWATDAMMAGSDSPNLRILAGLDRFVSPFEAEDQFKRARKELGLPTPNRDQALKDYAIHLAESIHKPASNFDILVAKLSELHHTNDYPDCPDYLMEWYSLDDGLTDIRSANYPYGFDELYQSDPSKIVVEIANTFITNNNEQDGAGQPPTHSESK